MNFGLTDFHPIQRDSNISPSGSPGKNSACTHFTASRITASSITTLRLDNDGPVEIMAVECLDNALKSLFISWGESVILHPTRQMIPLCSATATFPTFDISCMTFSNA